MVKLVALFCVLILVLLRNTESRKEFRVSAGLPAKSGQFPFLVSILVHEQHFCGGTIISEKVILTAAHCFKGKSAEHVTVVAGTVNLRIGGVRIPASRIIPHANFNFAGGDHDIGLVILSSPLNYSETIQPAVLPSVLEDYQNCRNCFATISGWGATNKQHGNTNVARYVKIPIWDRASCLPHIRHLTENMICAGSHDGQRNQCSGDSGSPLFIGNKVIGIVSFGFGCQAPSPAAYTNVPKFVSWIFENTKVDR